MKQAEAWLGGVGDDYYERNRDMGQHGDPVGDLIEHLKLKPKRVLEIGCGNGWRLGKLRDAYGCGVSGLDPSRNAVREGREAGLDLWIGTADNLPYPDNQFDVVIVGFCMWLIDPKEWLRVVAEVDRVLQMDGRLFIFDFITGRPLLLSRVQLPGMSEREREIPLAFYDYSKLWLAHPFYFKISETLKAVQFSGSNLLAIQGVVCLGKTMGQFLTGAAPSQDDQKDRS